MSTYIPKPNTGTLWPNDYKRTEQHPDKRGDLVLDREFLRQMLSKTTGQSTVTIQISGWSKVINGKDCLSMQASEPYVKPDAPAAPRSAPRPDPVDDSDIPF
jgi:hypothetical protein